MDLKELKKEVHDLPPVDENARKLEEHWLRLFSARKDSSVSLMKHLSPDVRDVVNKKTNGLKKDLDNLKFGQVINNKLKDYTRYLIELKLTTLNGNKEKSKMITNRLLTDDFFNMQQTIQDIKYFEAQIASFATQYEELNELLHNELPLEEKVNFMEFPYQKPLQNLLKASRKQKEFVQELGKHFVSMVRESKKK